MKPPNPGEKLRNGSILIASRRMSPLSIEHSFFIVLAMKVSEDGGVEYATWAYQEGDTFWGHYFETDIYLATKDFEDRGGL